MYEYNAYLLRVIDGDTFDLQVDVGFHIHVVERFRLADIDTPEIFKPQCEAERQHGKSAKLFCEKVLKDNLRIVVIKQGYYRRYIAHIYIQVKPHEWKSLRDLLVENGFEKREQY